MSIRIALIVLVVLLAVFGATTGETLKTASVWYAPILRSYFPDKIPIHGWNYPISDLPCLPKDITRFKLSAIKEYLGPSLGTVLQVAGAIKLGPIPESFVMGEAYVLHLQAYLFSDGKLVWKQRGFPRDNARVSARGDSRLFVLIE